MYFIFKKGIVFYLSIFQFKNKNMKKINSLFVLLFFYSYGFSQKLHSPAEILKMMEASKLAYNVKVLETEIKCTDYSTKLNYHDSYRVKKDNLLTTKVINPNNKARPLFEKAEGFLHNNKLDSALTYYKQTIEADSMLLTVITYVGQIYGMKKDYETAVKWYKLAIKKNYIDYMAHWFLADCYLNLNDLKNAVNEITIAQILNRNNPRIKKSMFTIFEKVKRNTNDWCFNPQYELNKKSDGTIDISISDKWAGYAMAKALWTFEPGYKESMGGNSNTYSMTEDKECLLSLVLSNEGVNVKNDPQLSVLREALENKHIISYIIYEILLPKMPSAAYQLPEETILEIKDYVLNFRHKK
jgi:tetratricopeptide (TPR) repeat protein